MKKLRPNKGKEFLIDYNYLNDEKSEVDRIKESDPLTFEYYMMFGDLFINIDEFDKKKMENRI